MNSEGKYLTAESFGHKVNATGPTMRKKQKWHIEQAPSSSSSSSDEQHVVHLISPLGFYMSTDKYGKISCDKASGDHECKFLLETNDRDGKWALRNVAHGCYLAGTGDQLHCFAKQAEWWTCHLALHPQINLKHALRKRYARLHGDEIHVDETIPWGSDCLITIEFRDEKYAIRTSNGMYLNKDGKLVTAPDTDTLYHVEFHRGSLAFKVTLCSLLCFAPILFSSTFTNFSFLFDIFVAREW